MTEEKAEVIDAFISIGERFLKGSKHFHLEPILTRDTIQAIKELQRENEQLNQKILDLQQELHDSEMFLISANNEVQKLNEKIKKMKCCGNCKWHRIENGGDIFCDCVGDCIDFSKWELKE